MEAIQDFLSSHVIKQTQEGISNIKLYVDLHIVLEIFLAMTVVHLLTRKRVKPGSDKLSKKEIDELCEEWEPEPLVPTVEPVEENVIVEKLGDGIIQADGNSLVDAATLNFLGLASNPNVLKAAESCLRKYGCGSCGPRGFYGTVDVHLELEQKFANFYGTAAGIIYSFDIATVSSIIPAFCKRGDVLLYDQGCNSSIVQGARLCRSAVQNFRHNDMKHLASLMETVQSQELKRNEKDRHRKFVAVEGLYVNSGDVSPLPNIIALARKYKFRIIMDDSSSLGTLGKTGKGACEHWNVDPKDVDIIVGSMSNTLATVGGFCVGSHAAIDHQRLASTGYCFSASLPPFNAVAAIEGLKYIEQNQHRVASLQAASKALYKNLVSAAQKANGSLARSGVKLQLTGEDFSCVQHVFVSGLADQDQQNILSAACSLCLSKGIAVTTAAHSALEPKCQPSIRLVAKAAMSIDQAATVAQTVIASLESVLSE